MKRIILLFSIISLIILYPNSNALGGRHHVGSTLICNDCHTNHYSMQHEYGMGATVDSGAEGPYTHLLKKSINEVCLSCHNNGSYAVDVLGSSSNNIVRQAGALNKDDGSTPNYPPSTGHSLDSTATAPGSDINWHNPDGLNCIDCHDPHGSVINYRNLRDDPGSAHNAHLTYAVGSNDLKVWVFERVFTPGINVYDVSNVDFNEPDPSTSGYAEWCSGCHTKFHGSKGSSYMGGGNGTKWLRHPSADANIGAVSNQHSDLETFKERENRVKVMDPDGNWSEPDGNETPSCFSCHKAHGNKNPFGLIYMSGNGQITEEGDASGSQLEDLCGQCHVQGQ